MKEVKILFVSIMCFILIGCSKRNNAENEKTLLHDLQKANEKFNLIENNFICNELDENSIIDGNIFVSGKQIYELNLQKIYSNGSNCMEVGQLQSNREAKYISSGRIVDNKGGVYRLKDALRDADYNSEKKEYKYDSNTTSNIIELYGSDSLFSGNSYANKFYKANIIIFNSKNLVGYYYESDMLASHDEIINIENILNEKIINIYGYIVKTDKNFYIITPKKINANECDKYSDIKCEDEYYLKKSNILSEHYDQILSISGSKIITKKYTYIDTYNIDW